MTTSDGRQPGVLDDALRRAGAIGAYLAAAGIVAIMLATCADVARRTLIGQSLPGVIEGSEVMLVIAAFLGHGSAQRAGAHVATSVVTDRLPERLSQAVRTLGLVAAMLFLLWLLAATGERAWESVQTREYRFGLIKVPVWPARVAITVGLALFTAEVARQTWQSARAFALGQRAVKLDEPGTTSGGEAPAEGGAL